MSDSGVGLNESGTFTALGGQNVFAIYKTARASLTGSSSFNLIVSAQPLVRVTVTLSGNGGVPMWVHYVGPNGADSVQTATSWTGFVVVGSDVTVEDPHTVSASEQYIVTSANPQTAPAQPGTLTFTYQHGFMLTVTSPNGTTFGAGWQVAGAPANFGLLDSISNATSNTRDRFVGWTGVGNASYSGPLLA